MTRVVTEALRERLELLQARREKASVEELIAIAKRASFSHRFERSHLIQQRERFPRNR